MLQARKAAGVNTPMRYDPQLDVDLNEEYLKDLEDLQVPSYPCDKRTIDFILNVK